MDIEEGENRVGFAEATLKDMEESTRSAMSMLQRSKEDRSFAKDAADRVNQGGFTGPVGADQA